MATPIENPTMKAMLVDKFCSVYGEVNDIMHFSNEEAKPKLGGKPTSTDMIIRVLACSLSAGDTLMLKGDILFLRPKSFPFIPGMNVCGVVEETDPGVTKFKVGDVVVASNGTMPVGGMAEYMKVEESRTAKKPDGVGILEASSCFSAVTALHASEYVQKGDRVLVLGGSGGVGTAALQLSKAAGASLVVTTSSQVDLCKSLGADVVIEYNKDNWWEMEEYQTNKFDKIVDCVGGGNFSGKAQAVLKPRNEGGRFVAVTGDNPRPDMSTPWRAFSNMSQMAWNPLWTMLSGARNPGYILILPRDDPKDLTNVLQKLADGKLKVVLDPSSPLEFTEGGVKKAYTIQGGGHAHGKVVVQVASA